MNYNPENPLIIQSDLTVLLEVISPKYEEARNELVRFAELEKSPEHMHTYRIHPLSLWNAAASKITADEIITVLETYSKYEIPQNVGFEINEAIARYGKVILSREGDAFILSSEDALIITEVCRHKSVKPYIEEKLNANRVRIAQLYRGHIKQALTRLGYPVKDMAGYLKGTALAISTRETSRLTSALSMPSAQNAPAWRGM